MRRTQMMFVTNGLIGLITVSEQITRVRVCSTVRIHQLGRITPRTNRARATGLAAHSATRHNATGHHHASRPVRLQGGHRINVVSHVQIMSIKDPLCQTESIDVTKGTSMRLAEALALRGDLQKRIDQLRERIQANARYQEGEDPSENAVALLAEAGSTIDELETLIAAINKTNSVLAIPGGQSMTAALAARDMLRLRHSVFSVAANAATGHGSYRQMRSELRQIAALDVPDVRAQIDKTAQALRELDGRIQEANWTNDLVEN